jgi:acyl-CoA synthetase (AMP-forming)/AMP-acid ligase II
MSLGPESWIDALDGWTASVPAANAFRYLRDGEVEAARLSWAELDTRVRAVAGVLRRHGLRGERVLLLQPPGIEFVCAFLGCLRGGAIAVPLYPPNLTRQDGALARLLRVAADCRPAAAIVPEAQRPRFAALAAEYPALREIRWLPCESLDEGSTDVADDRADAGDLAFLQYTSGSTGVPRGVRVTHANIAHNARRITASYGMQPLQTSVSWLPPYHDMGLIGYVLQPVFIGADTTLMSPFAFLQRPLRWLEALSRFRGNISFAPNFAYELVLRKVRPEHLLRLDLRSWTIAGNGAEPVRLDTLNRFAATFEPCGFRREAFCPSYGLAECTLLASSDRGVHSMAVDPAALEHGQVVAADAAFGGARALVSMGRPAEGLAVTIVDPESQAPVGANRVGEVWISGDSVADGYFNRPEDTAATFAARLPGDSAEDGAPYLRTGDLGFLHDGALFVTGRLKDLIIVDGRNHYPQDIEETAAGAIPGAAPANVIAFSVERDGREELVVAAESPRGVDRASLDEVITAVRRAIAEGHDLQLAGFVWVRPGRLPRTGSGKPQRRACRAAYLAGELDAMEVGR